MSLDNNRLASWVLLLEMVSMLMIRTVAQGDYVLEDISAYSFGQVLTYQSNVTNAMTCASLCLPDATCQGFYFNINSKSCQLAGGGLRTFPDANYNSPAIRLYRYKGLSPLSCLLYDGFKEMTINGIMYCFLLVNQKVTYTQAQTGCSNRNAVLFHFDDDAVKWTRIPEIRNMFSSGVNFFWIGLHSLQANSNWWYWDYSNQRLTNGELSSLSWYSNIYTEKRSGCALAQVDAHHIDSDPCTNQERYLCEIALG